MRFSIELDDYERVPDDPEEYGKQVLERIGADEELISTLDGFTDFEAMGNFLYAGGWCEKDRIWPAPKAQ